MIGPVAPKAIADRIVSAIPENPFIESASAAPNGFINIKLATKTMISSIAAVVTSGVRPPQLPACRVLVDFSSPNIAKEMHVGHLRSTIIGDSISRLFEFCGFDVMRVNHVGDWSVRLNLFLC